MLLLKLSPDGMPEYVLELFQSYLTNRQKCVTVGTKTSLSTLKVSLPQGSVLGPILFHCSLMIYPYIKALCELFADDVSLHNHHTNLDALINSLQHSIHRLIDWTELNHMALHPNKIKFTLITTKEQQQQQQQQQQQIKI